MRRAGVICVRKLSISLFNLQIVSFNNPDKVDIQKLKVNCFVHILLLDVRFPGEVAPQAKAALLSALEGIKDAAVKQLQGECTPCLTDRLLDLIKYHQLLMSHLEHQQTVVTFPFQEPTLADVKLLELPAGAPLPLHSDSDSDIDDADFFTDDENGLLDSGSYTPSHRLSFLSKPRKRKREKETDLEETKADLEVKESQSEFSGPVIKRHRTVREQLQFLVQHQPDSKVIAETKFVYDRPDIIDEYLGNPMRITGSKFTDRGWVYEIVFEKFSAVSLNIPAQYAENYAVFGDMWSAHAGGELLSARGRPSLQVFIYYTHIFLFNISLTQIYVNVYRPVKLEHPGLA